MFTAEFDVQELPTRWREMAVFQEVFFDNGRDAATLRSVANELEVALDARENELLTLSEAATESGYSVDHIGYLVRSGGIPNAGRLNAPRIARRHLPKKARANPPLALVPDESDTPVAQIVQSIIEEGAA